MYRNKSLVLLIMSAFVILIIGCLDDPGEEGCHNDGGGHHTPSLHVIDSKNNLFKGTFTISGGDCLEINTDYEVSAIIRDSAGTELPNATVTAELLMPSMGHGGNGTPTVHNQGAGEYHIMKINFSMVGTWELHVDVTNDSITDMFHVDYSLE